ncbi:CAP domain-containing protein [candidate division KSB1 bacterium]|nr:CAP domain-containing protein [candidate division KSB1 bacterium]
MQRFYLAITILIFCSLAFSKSRTLWTPEKYEEYHYRTFSQLSVVQHPINMNNIDYFLLHAAIFYETNRIRAKAGLPRLKHSYNLEVAAKSHSSDMVVLDFFDHQSPIEDKQTVLDRLEQVGLANGYMAENIAYVSGIRRDPDRPIFTPKQNSGYFSHEYRGRPIPNHSYLSLAREVVRQWMLSESHRKNILNPQYRYLGCGAEHFRDPDFFYMDRFKITQYFSSHPGRHEDLKQPKHERITYNIAPSRIY